MNTIDNAAHYDEQFYMGQKEISRRSASLIIPYLQQLFNPKSVADVGCGVGTWLSVWKDLNVGEIIGIDGDYVDRSQLQINLEEFYPFDLTTPLAFDKKYDIVTSFEVGEHIPNEHSAIFVKNICSLSNIVAFSAALPGQGGTNHINEQWPHVWAQYFEANEFKPIDCIRNKIWNNNEIGYYYRQNIIIFVHISIYDQFKHLNEQQNLIEYSKFPLPLVHPITLQNAIKRNENLERKLLESRTDVRAAYHNFKTSFKQKIMDKLGL